MSLPFSRCIVKNYRACYNMEKVSGAEQAKRNKLALKQTIPVSLFWISGMFILLLGGDLSISLAGWKIFIIPIIITLIILIFLIHFIKKSSTSDLKEHLNPEKKISTILVKITFFLVNILILRQLMIWKYYNPWEKMPMALLIVMQLMLVNNTNLKSIGLNGWKKNSLFLAGWLAAIEFILLSFSHVLFLFIGHGTQVANSLSPCLTCQLYWLSFPYQFLAVAFSEELFFRGYIYTKLRIYFKERHEKSRAILFSIIITNVLFGLFHVPWYVRVSDGTLTIQWMECIIRVASTGTMGILLTLLYEKTGNLSVSMLVHGLSNSIQPLIVYSGSPINLIDGLPAMLYTWQNAIISIFILMVSLAFIKWYLKKRWKAPVSTPWDFIPTLKMKEENKN
ncbi:MAG: lysostaphin resistance A-like protein [Promethearchaeota archaeon]